MTARRRGTFAAELFCELGFQVPSAHTALPLGDTKDEVLRAAALLGCRRIISGKGPDSFKTMDLIKQSCDEFNQAYAVAAENGLAFGLHNHWWEFERIAGDGRYVYQVMLKLLDPGIFFEIDTYWVQTAGPNAARIVGDFGARAPLLHIKDGPANKEKAMQPIGSGVMDFPAVVKASAGNVEWMIVELDRCDGDMMDAVVESYRYLTAEGLATGNK